MTAYLLTWNPKRWPPDEVQGIAKVLRRKRTVKGQWSCASSNQIRKGDRLFIMKQGRDPRGIFGSGWATSDAFKAPHWKENSQSKSSMYVKLIWDSMVDPDSQPILSREDLKRRYVNEPNWDAQSSGTRIADAIADDLDSVWAEFLATNFGSSLSTGQDEVTRPYATRHGAGFGNPENNPVVEKAAVDLVTTRYRQLGWKVKTVEHEKCGFDLRCTKVRTVQEVEVKGIAGSHENFIITAGEVNQARNNVIV